MTWARLDDKDVSDHRLIALSVEARLLYWAMQIYLCSDALYDHGGHFTAKVLRSVVGMQLLGSADKLADELIGAGLWQRTNEGYFDPDWSRRNWSRDKKAKWEADHA
jgi:hypothetical protein